MNWEQFRAILWLRWRLTRNQMTRGSGLGAVIAALAVVALVLVAVGGGVGAIFLGAVAMKSIPAPTLMWVWDGLVLVILFFSLMGVLSEVQRSESVDLTRLLHLPVSLRQVFVFNYLASLISFGTVVGLAFMLGLAVGLTVSRGPRFVLAMPLVLGFVFMVTAWIYCLRGWLLSLMVNPRRRRAIAMWIMVSIILIAQSPQLINLAYQRKARSEREARRATQVQQLLNPDASTASATNAAVTNSPTLPEARPDASHAIQIADVITLAHPWVPVLWLPHGVRRLAEGSFLPAIWGAAGMIALGWFGLRRSYQTTLRFYRAEEKPRSTSRPIQPAKAVPNWVERSLPYVPDDIAGMALAQLRSMTRAPEVKMMLGMGLFMAILLPGMIFLRGGVSFPVAGKPFFGTIAVVMVLFALLQLVSNQFGCDRDGFRGLVLLPTPRDRLLAGKNLALLPMAAAVAFIPLTGVAILAKLPVPVVVATLLQFGAAFLLFCTLGNLASILAPYRIAAGSLKPTKQSWQTALVALGAHCLFPFVVSPVFLPPALGYLAQRLAGLPAALVNMLAAFLMAAGFAWLYVITLRPLGRLLQRRETNILRAVTETTE
ncbi:MAG: hypothetical protein KIS67_06680 [Verrucomicrobiae bacterium]|nr:hypothetical protein [Verrucomicrobiae bacterium]